VTLLDTSAILALMDSQDRCHQPAARFWVEQIEAGSSFLTHSYVVVEATALAQRRFGFEAARYLHDDLLSAVECQVVEPDLHQAGVTAFLAAGSRSVSLVDQISFALMRRRGIRSAFAFDSDFRQAGFETVPAGR
jgi:predicted nucleic acid-binding protein